MQRRGKRGEDAAPHGSAAEAAVQTVRSQHDSPKGSTHMRRHRFTAQRPLHPSGHQQVLYTCR